MIELQNWLVELFVGPFSSAAAAITVLLSITFLIMSLREWTNR